MRTRAVLALMMVSLSLTPASAQSLPAGPRFDVVSIKRLPDGSSGANRIATRPDGGLTVSGLPVSELILGAYVSDALPEVVGLPEWASRDRYEVSATASLSAATEADRQTMVRAMLADRFRLLVHFEKREQPVFDLLQARSDGRLSAGMMPISADCTAKLAADRAAAETEIATGKDQSLTQRQDRSAPPSACALRFVFGGGAADRLEGETDLANLTAVLRTLTGRTVVDKTGLKGSYRVLLEFSRAASLRGPDVTSAKDVTPTIFTAVVEQLGLKLESSRAMLDTLVIDRLELPTDN